MLRQLRPPTPSIGDRPALMLDFKTIVVIDPAVKNRQLLADGLIEGATVVLLDSNQDGVQQITEAIRNRTDIANLCLVANSTSDCLNLGTSRLSLATLDRYAWDLQTWFASLPSSFRPQLRIYGCNITSGGAELIKRLEQLTGATIAAIPASTGTHEKDEN